jgi:F0F1-type ATP synthase membrane subunit b/b'
MNRARPNPLRRAAWALALAAAGLCAVLPAFAASGAITPVPAARAKTTQQPIFPKLPTGRGAAAPVAHTAAPPRQKEAFSKTQVSLWLRPVARATHLSTGLLWTIVWLINLGILLWVLYFVFYRMRNWSLPGLMHNRTHTIRRRLADAEEAVVEATERLRSIEARLAGVGAEVAALQAQTRQEAELEYRRLTAESVAEAEKIAQAAARQIAASSQTARLELRHYAAELAVAVAERRLRRDVNGEMDEVLVRQAAGHFAAAGRQPV